MILAKDIQIYLKTTETCNLNCAHCFTTGKNGRKIFFNPVKTADFIKTLVHTNQVHSTRIIFHGGEPTLAPLEDMYTFFEQTRHEIPQVNFGIQTNLVYRLTPQKLKFFSEVIGEGGIGTSWDPKIRFGSTHKNLALEEEKMWEANVRTLVSEGHALTLMVSLSKYIIEEYEPIEVIKYAISLGIKYILFERITTNGNAVSNNDILPRNTDIDQWLFKMYQQTMEHQLHKHIGNMFLEEIAHSYVNGLHVANRCRGCEQKIITINADGGLSGCPNSAAETQWGNITDGTQTFLGHKLRIGAICKEKTRNINCSTCEVSDLCHGDCYKLKWDGDICSAPKTLMRFLKNNNVREASKDLFI